MAKLVGMSIAETSGVDHPAHLREGWMIMKATDIDEANGLLDRIKAAVAGQDNMEGQMTEEITENVIANSDDLVKANERIAELESLLSLQTETVAVVEDVEEELMKSVPEAVRKMLDDQKTVAVEAMAKAAAMESDLRKERSMRADEIAVAKAATWTSLTLDSASVGPMLRRLAEVDLDLAKAVETVLESANAQSESAGIFAEIGKSVNPVGGDAYEALSSLASSAVESGVSATFEQAFVKVAEQNPDLYLRHLTEKGA